jgi:hypothetical protein
VGPADPVAREDPGGPVTPVAPVVQVDLAARARADPAGQVTVVDPGDMNRVVAATVGTAAVMAPADLASQVGPAVRVDMILEGPVDPVGMTLADRVAMILGDPEGRLRAPNLVGPVGMILGDPEGRLRAPNLVVRADPASREATDLSLGRALLGRTPTRLGRMPMRRHLTVARPLLMPAFPHLTPVDRRRDLTTRAVATCQEATRVGAPRQEATQAEATQAVALRRAEATRRPGRLTAERNYRGGPIESRYAR